MTPAANLQRQRSGIKHPAVSKAGGVFDIQSNVPLSHHRARWISGNYTVVNSCLMDAEQSETRAELAVVGEHIVCMDEEARHQ